MVLGLLAHVTPSGQFLGEKLYFKNHIFVRTAVLRKLFDIRFSYKHCNFFTRLHTRQDGVENRDKVYDDNGLKMYISKRGEKNERGRLKT